MTETPRCGFCNAELKGESMKFDRDSILLQIDYSKIFTSGLVN